MITVQDVHEENRVVILDDRNFIGCSFKECTLMYSGGDYGWADTKFENCKVKLMGPAGRTMNVIKALNLMQDKVTVPTEKVVTQKLSKLPLRH